MRPRPSSLPRRADPARRIFIAYLLNALIWTFAPTQLFQLGVGFGITLPCVLGSRLLLNLRAVHRHETPTASLIHTQRWDHLLNISVADA